MTLTFDELANILNDLSYLYSEHGDVIAAEEAVIIRKILSTATNQGLEFLDKEHVQFAIDVYKKYENKNLVAQDDEEGEI